MSHGLSLLEEIDSFSPIGGPEQPVFRQDCSEYTMFYAPGYVSVVDRARAGWFESIVVSAEQGQERSCATELRRRATATVRETRMQREGAFNPECLTLYMNNQCNLSCTYCYADPALESTSRLALNTVAAAADVVAETCRQKDRPFCVVFHGGGEPTLHHDRLERALARLKATAAAYDVQLFCYVATNGVLSEEKATWLADHFDLVGLSCDGPPDIQDAQRPYRDGRTTSHTVERTARVLREEGCRFHVRATITRASRNRQAEIVDYVSHRLVPEEIRFEPVYQGGRSDAADKLSSHQAREFVAHFLQAQETSRKHGIPLRTSGSRPNEIHGPYCHLFRQTLNLVPGGAATACFKVTDRAQAEKKGVILGSLNGGTGRFEVDSSRARDLRRRLSAVPAECTDCFNRYHCVRGCPDRCPLDGGSVSETGFRCKVQKSLSYARLRKTAESLWLRRKSGEGRRGEACGAAIRR